jgi:hypothetical protein
MDRNNGSGVGLIGSIVAGVLSWGTHHAFWWMVFHFLCGWIYVVYWLFVYWNGKLPGQ